MLVCAFATLTAAAQASMTWRAELGAGVSTWMGKNADGTKAICNPKIGVGVDIPLTNVISFQAGLSWVSKGTKYDTNELFSDRLGKVELKVNQNYFQMPLLAAFHIGTGTSFDLVLKGGAYLAVGVCGRSEIEYDDLTIGWDTFGDKEVENLKLPGLHRFDAGIITGLDFDFDTWFVGCEGEFGLCKVAGGDAPRNFAFFMNIGHKF